jgi:hypothetical protein
MGMRILNVIKAFRVNKSIAQAVARNGSPNYNTHNVVIITHEMNQFCIKEKA